MADLAAPVIPNQYVPPPPTATPDMGGGGVPSTPPPTAPQVNPTAAQSVLSGDPGAQMNHATAVHHSRLAQALNAVGTLLGGDTTYHITTNADGSVDATPTPSTPGEKWGRIAKAALMGGAKGFEVGQGPGGAQRAAAAGIETGMQMPQAQQDQTLQLAEKMNNQNQQRLMFNANMAMLDQKIIAARNENERSGVTFQQQVQDHTLNFAKSLRDMGGEFVSHFKDNDEMAQQLQQNKLLQAHLGTNGMTIPLTTFDAKGIPNGIDAWILPEDKRNQLNKSDITIPLMKPDPQNPGKLIEDTPYVIGANTMRLGDVAGAIKSIHDNNNQMTSTAWSALNAKKETDIKAQMVPSEIAKNRAAAAESTARAGLADVQTTLAPQTLDVKAGQALSKNMLYHDKNYVQPALQSEQSYRLANNAYNDYMNAAAKGQELPTGAQSMLMLSQHLANTFGTVKGARVTKDMIQEHLGARSITDSMEVAINRLVNGDQLSSAQWGAFHKLIGEARLEKWRTAASEGARLGVAQNYLPTDLAPTLGRVAGSAPTPTGAATAPAAGTPAAAPATSPGAFNWGAQPAAPAP
jgi:hypothetical protein